MTCGKRSREVHSSLPPLSIEVRHYTTLHYHFDPYTDQHVAALIEGAALAKKLGKSGDNYAAIAPQALCFLQSYWIPSGKYVDSNSKYLVFTWMQVTHQISQSMSTMDALAKMQTVSSLPFTTLTLP